jgi:hypothetical protein
MRIIRQLGRDLRPHGRMLDGELGSVRWGHWWFSFAGVARARLVPGGVTSVAVLLPGDRHVAAEPAVEVEVVAAGLAGSGVAD